MENKIENFFFAGNAVSGKPDYGLAETFLLYARLPHSRQWQPLYRQFSVSKRLIDLRMFPCSSLFEAKLPYWYRISCTLLCANDSLNLRIIEMHTFVCSLISDYPITLY